MKKRSANTLQRNLIVVLAVILRIPNAGGVSAQDRLKTMPGYEQYQKMNREIPGSVKLGGLSVVWKDGGQAFEFRRDGKAYNYTIATRTTVEVAPTGENNPPPPGASGGRHRGADRKSTRLNSSHVRISYAVFCL